MIPVNVVMVLWVWMGRIVFGVGGWFLFILAVSVVPLMLLALAVTTVLAYYQRFLQRFPGYRLSEAPTRGGRARFRGFLNAPFRSG